MITSSAAVQSQADDAHGEVYDACGDLRFEGSSFTLCSYDPSRHDLQTFVTDGRGKALRRFSALQRDLGVQAKRVVFAVNAGMFDDAGLPIGLYVENGEERFPINERDAPGNFYLRPNGIFWIDARGPHVSDTQSYLKRGEAGLRVATQSGPMLVIAGQIHPKFDADGKSRNIRNGVGVGRHGQALFLMSRDPVSFGKFARAFRDHLGCDNALFLDGAVSSIWNGQTGQIDQRADVGPMIVVFEKAP
jgi:uncharacterized protein YigE (DUF2233 family)